LSSLLALLTIRLHILSLSIHIERWYDVCKVVEEKSRKRKKIMHTHATCIYSHKRMSFVQLTICLTHILLYCQKREQANLQFIHWVNDNEIKRKKANQARAICIMIKKISSIKRIYNVKFTSLRQTFIDPILCIFIHCIVPWEPKVRKKFVVFNYYWSSFVNEMHRNIHQLQTLYNVVLQFICSIQWNRINANDIVRMLNNNINNNKNNRNNDKYWYCDYYLSN